MLSQHWTTEVYIAGPFVIVVREYRYELALSGGAVLVGSHRTVDII